MQKRQIMNSEKCARGRERWREDEIRRIEDVEGTRDELNRKGQTQPLPETVEPVVGEG